MTESAVEATRLEVATTQRAYTLRLRGVDGDPRWRDALWTTHEAVNKGAKVFGDWLLTLRGGLDHKLADQGPENLRTDRRILSALSWLSVESDKGSPPAHVAAKGNESGTTRQTKVFAAFENILKNRGVTDIESWRTDCQPSLSAAIRNDAVWVNRSNAFDAAVEILGKSLTRDDSWDMLDPFFVSSGAYLESMATEIVGDESKKNESGEAEKAKDLVQKAGHWLSSRFGTGKGADFNRMGKVYQGIATWAAGCKATGTGTAIIFDLAKSLAAFDPTTKDVQGILNLISGPGYKSATRNILQKLADNPIVSSADLETLADAATKDQDKCAENIGGKGRRAYSDMILVQVKDACGIDYLQPAGPARHQELSVMLDHAARRVSLAHTWIKRAEAERRAFEEDATRIGHVSDSAKFWLDTFCCERSAISGATDESYRIRKRALGGWEQIITKWSNANCKVKEDRIAAAREVQADPEIDKFGDIQLFEALADDEAMCVWRVNGEITTKPLKDYAAARDAQAKKQRFKVPAYRHPDALLHPVFCDFGNSRWDISFACHKAPKSLEAQRTMVTKRQSDVVKRQIAFDKAKTPEKKNDAAMAFEAALARVKEAEDIAAWLTDRHALSMGLWTGQTLQQSYCLRWSSKRLTKDLALQPTTSSNEVVGVTRADRLGRAAAAAGKDTKVGVLGLFDEDHWNGRLQAPRGQLDSIAKHLEAHGWDAKAKNMLDRIRWLISFSAKLQAKGPWIDYAKNFSEDSFAKPFVSRKGEFAVKHQGNDARKGSAKLVLSRLPGLRILSADLGHRYAAACAVWETLDSKQMKSACLGANHALPTESGLSIHLATTGTDGKKRTIIYRRIGPDKLSDGNEHAAPWARLERQFLIKLQGEETSPRAASAAEVDYVNMFAARLGLIADDDAVRSRRVDELMARAVRVATLALKRHARRAKIAYALDPKTSTIFGMGGKPNAFQQGDSTHLKLLTDALVDWYSLATENKWNDHATRELWNRHIATLDGAWIIDPPKGDADDRTRQQRRKDEDALCHRLKPLVERLAATKRTAIFQDWHDRWHADDGNPRHADKPSNGLYTDLRRLTDWIMGRRLVGETGDAWKRHVGGLSLTRIATLRSLYQLHKAFAMRAMPDKPRGAPEKGETNIGIADSILTAMERMRENRVKQLASRIASSALGLGGHWRQIELPQLNKDGKPKRRWHWQEEASSKYAPCHAVVIENLTNYRPEETRTRRENRQLMSWSSSKVKKYLSEACQLHGLHVREVQAGYTSRQDSRTGARGARCSDVSVKEFMTAPWWRRQVKAAKKKADENAGSARDRYLLSLDDLCGKIPPENSENFPPLRIPVNGGEIFVSADLHSPAAKGLQADLNAAANIGLKALLDSDFAGKWWYVPCKSATGAPDPEKVGGSPLFDDKMPLGKSPEHPAETAAVSASGKHSKGKSKNPRDIVNRWRDLSAATIQDDSSNWVSTGEYWNNVHQRVTNLLGQRNQIGLTEKSIELVETPW